MTDPLVELADDHRVLNGLLVAVHGALQRIQRGTSTLDDELHEIRDGIEAFREAVLEHFAREQEGVLPFAHRIMPAASERIDRLVVQHDRIAEALTALARDLEKVGSDSLTSFETHLTRFEELYAAHSRDETQFLRELAAAVADDAALIAQLRELLASA